MENQNKIQEMKDKALKEDVPIIQDDALRFLLNYLKENHVLRILEVGTAVGYSAIMMCSVNENITVTTIERDEKRYLEALQNIKKLQLEERISLIFKDAFDVTLEEEYDFIFIDAAKAQNKAFFEKFEKYLKPGGTILTDNMKFHGLVDQKEETIPSRNLRGLVRKIKEYKVFLENHPGYITTFYPYGDGLAVSRKREV